MQLNNGNGKKKNTTQHKNKNKTEQNRTEPPCVSVCRFVGHVYVVLLRCCVVDAIVFCACVVCVLHLNTEGKHK